MKNSIKTTIVIIAGFLTTSAMAQTIGVTGGLNLSKVNFENATSGSELEYLPGINLGISFNKSLGNVMAFETGLGIDQRGYKISYESGDESAVGKLNLYYGTVPLLFKSYLGSGDNKVILQLGSTIGFGISGNSKSKQTVNGETTENSEKIEWDDNDIRRFDMGLNAGAGYKFGKMECKLGYYYGFVPLNKNNSNDGAFNRTISLGASYYFR